MKNRLAEIRSNKKITQDELAAAAGVTRNHISRIENGVCSPSMKVLSRIAKFLEVKIDDIFLD